MNLNVVMHQWFFYSEHLGMSAMTVVLSNGERNIVRKLVHCRAINYNDRRAMGTYLSTLILGQPASGEN